MSVCARCDGAGGGAGLVAHFRDSSLENLGLSRKVELVPTASSRIDHFNKFYINIIPSYLAASSTSR